MLRQPPKPKRFVKEVQRTVIARIDKVAVIGGSGGLSRVGLRARDVVLRSVRVTVKVKERQPNKSVVRFCRVGPRN